MSTPLTLSSAPQSIAPRSPDAAAARLTWIQLPGPEIDAGTDRLLAQGVGGVILFSRNISGARELRALIAALRKRAAVPLQVAIDHEGGHVLRIGAPLTRFPSAMAVAATGHAALALEASRASARELAWLGVDVNLAPVLDVAGDPRNASVGARSYGSDPEVVSRFGAAAVRGFLAGGVLPTAKHFPGHGRTAIDPHLDLPRITGGLETLRAVDLPPFRAALEAGAPLVMASHVAYEGLTDGLPATLSRSVLVDLLRGELGFRGATITDAMAMGAVAAAHDPIDACVTALEHGVDVVLPAERDALAIEAIANAIARGRLAERRVAEALERVERLETARRALPADDASAQREEPPETAAHAELAAEIARRSLTLVSDARASILPIAPSASVALVEFASRRPSPVEDAQTSLGDFGVIVGRRLPRIEHVVVAAEAFAPTAVVGAEPPLVRAELALTAAARADVVVIATRDAYLWQAERALIEQLVTLARRSVLAALRNPYDIAALPATDVAIAAYGDVPVTLEALADALAGRAALPGRLPLELGVPSAAP